MSQFKAMKFWIGEDAELSKRVQEILFSLGYKWVNGETIPLYLNDPKETVVIYTYPDGIFIKERKYSFVREYFDSYKGECIDIDWMRTPKKETIELNGKKYLKEDLEEALKHIRPVE